MLLVPLSGIGAGGRAYTGPVKRLVVLALLVAACRKTAETPDAAPAPLVVPPLASTTTEPEAVRVDGGARAPMVSGPYAEMPEPTAGVLGSDRVVGFSKDDRYLGFEYTTCDACPTEYRFRGPGVPEVHFSEFWGPALDEEVAAKKRAVAEANVAKQLGLLGPEHADRSRFLRGPFPYPDLVFAAKPTRDPKERVGLLVGAHVPGEEPVFPLRIELGTHPMRGRPIPTWPGQKPQSREAFDAEFTMQDPELAYVNVTRDGTELGAVAMASGTMWFETGGVARMSAAAFAAQIYNDTGIRKLAAKENRAAAALFAKAEAAKPDAVFAYNLACALAREDDASAEAPLARAIARSASYRERARKDADFERVRAAPWFTKLVR